MLRQEGGYMSDLLQLTKEFEEVELLALITSSSAEVIFYCKINNKVYQSNNLVEEGLYDGNKMDEFYQKMTAAIRQSEKFRSDMLNIVKIDKTNNISFQYVPQDCSSFKIKREWKNTLFSE